MVYNNQPLKKKNQQSNIYFGSQIFMSITDKFANAKDQINASTKQNYISL